MTYRVRTPFALTEGGASYRVEPADDFRLDGERGVGSSGDRQAARRMDVSTRPSFGREIAGARTFGFEREVAELRARGFALGGGAWRT